MNHLIRHFSVLIVSCLSLGCQPASTPLVQASSPPMVTVSGQVYAPIIRFKTMALTGHPDEKPVPNITVYFNGRNAQTDENGRFQIQLPANQTYPVEVHTIGKDEPYFPDAPVSYCIVGSSDVEFNFNLASCLVGSKILGLNGPYPTDAEKLTAAVRLMEQDLAKVQTLPGPLFAQRAGQEFDQLASGETKTLVYELAGKPLNAPTPLPTADTTVPTKSELVDTLYYSIEKPAGWRPAPLQEVSQWKNLYYMERLKDRQTIATMALDVTETEVDLETIKEAWIQNAGSDEKTVTKVNILGNEAYLVTRIFTNPGNVKTEMRKYLVEKDGRVFSFGLVNMKDDASKSELHKELEAILNSVVWKQKSVQSTARD